MTFNASLVREMAGIATITNLVETGKLNDDRYTAVRFHQISAETELAEDGRAQQDEHRALVPRSTCTASATRPRTAGSGTTSSASAGKARSTCWRSISSAYCRRSRFSSALCAAASASASSACSAPVAAHACASSTRRIERWRRDVQSARLARRLAHEALDRRGGGGIEHRHRREIDDIGLRMLADAVERGGDAGRGAEEERAGDPVDHDVRIGRDGRIVAGTRGRRFLVRPCPPRSSAADARPRPPAPCGAGTAARRCRSRPGCLRSGRGRPPAGTSRAAPPRRRARPAAGSRTACLSAMFQATTASTAASAASGM